MALIRFGGGVADARGSVGGQVFSKNRYGNYLRARITPVNPSSDRQQEVRNNLASLVERWSAVLTAAQRAAWNTYAANVPWVNKLGESIYLTGYNMYIRSNIAILQVGGTIVDAGPTTLSLPSTDPTFAVTASESTQLVSVAGDDTMDWLDEDGGWLSVSCSLPRSAGREYVQGPFRWMDAVEGDSVTPPTLPATMTAPFTIAEDQVITCQARIIRADGRVSTPFLDTVAVSS